MGFRFIFSSLSPGQLEFLFRALAMMAGSSISPGWHLFREAVRPWIDVQMLARSDNPVLEILQFYHRLQLDRELLISSLMPKLFLCLAISLTFIFICNKIGQLAARYVINKRLASA